MPTTVSGDYSAYPISIREIFPMLFGEACLLKEAYDIYFYLFMAKQERTEIMSKMLGGVLGIFQNLLQDELFLSIARITDKDSKMQKNVSLWTLLTAIPDAKNQNFGAEVTDALNEIYESANNIRKHRHKRIAHFDLSTSLSASLLPVVTFKEIDDLIRQIADFLNIFAGEFSKTTIAFDCFSSLEITHPAEVTSYKAVVYDLLVQEGVIPLNEWRKRTGN